MKANAPSALWLQRVENLVGEGMPDVYVGSSGRWVELKAPPKVPVRARTPLLGNAYGLRESQVNWHLKNADVRNGFTSYILIRTPAPERKLFLIPGTLASAVNCMSMEKLTSVNVASDWESIMKEIGR
jgi:hypothetical protein